MGVFDRLPGLAGGDETTRDDAPDAEGADDEGEAPEADAPSTPADDPTSVDPVDYRDRAEALAARSNVPTLDFTVASLEKLDTMVEGPTIPVEDPVALGSYLGETLVRTYDGSWIRDDGPAVAVDLADDATAVAVFDAARMALQQGPVFQDVAARLEAEGATPIDGVPPTHREVDAATPTVAPKERDRSDGESGDGAHERDEGECNEVGDEPERADDESDTVEGDDEAVEDAGDESDEDADAHVGDEADDAGDGTGDASEERGDDDDAAESENDGDEEESVQADESSLDEDADRDGPDTDDAEPEPAIGRVGADDRPDAEEEPDAAVGDRKPDDVGAENGTGVAADEGVDADGAGPEGDAVAGSTEDPLDDGTDDVQGAEPVEEEIDVPASTAIDDAAEPTPGPDRADDNDDGGRPGQQPNGERAASDDETPGGSDSEPGEGPPAVDGTEPATEHGAEDLAGPTARVETEGEGPDTADGDGDGEVAADEDGPETAADDFDDADGDAGDPALDVTVDEIEIDEADGPGSPVAPGSLPGTGAARDEGVVTDADGPDEDETDGDSLGVAADIADLAAAGGDADAATSADGDASDEASEDVDASTGASPQTSPADAGDSQTSQAGVDRDGNPGGGSGIDADDQLHGEGAPDAGGGPDARSGLDAETGGDDAGRPGTAEGGVDADDVGATEDEPAPDEVGSPPSRVAGDAEGSMPFEAARDDGTLEDLAAELSSESLPPRPELKRAAREFGDAWPDREFDRSPASLARLDGFLDGQWNGRFEPGSLVDESAHPRDGLTSLARVGAYVGQVLVENLDGEWVPTEDGEGAVEVAGRGDTTEEVPVFDVARECMTGESTLSYQFDALANRVGSEASARAVDDVFDVRDRRADSTVVIPAILDRAEAVTERWPAASLDYSPASLDRLDEIVEAEFDVADRSGVHVGESSDPASLLLTERVTSAAAYYATVCVNHLDANWRIDEDVALLIEGPTGSRTVDPVSVAAGAIRGEDTFTGHFERIAERVGRESAVPE